MAYTTIDKSSLHFNTKLYTGNGSTNAQTGIGFQPSWTWIKTRSHAGYVHALVDATRGVTKEIRSNANTAEVTTTNSFTSFDSDGFTLGADSGDNYNKSGNTYVAWNWKANGQGSSNTSGTINTTYTSANTTSGFSIIKFQGNGSVSQTIGHGLGVKPKIFLIKNLDASSNSWQFYFNDARRLILDDNVTGATDNLISSSSSLITLPSSVSSAWGYSSGVNYIAYCFAEKIGFSKFGEYTGNGNADGPFIYTGFKPAWFLWKPYNAADSWNVVDNKREGYNPDNNRLFPNGTDAEDTQDRVDLVSNGIKIKTSDGGTNSSSRSYIFMAFAEAPLVGSNNIPATAR